MNEHYEFTNPPLPYAFNALEPFIDEKTMELHHNRHLQTYVNNLNGILKNYPQYQNLSLEQLLKNIAALPQEIQIPVKNNAGGVYNHIFYFENMTPNPQTPPLSLMKLFESIYGGFDNFKDAFTKAALSVFGSGYTWLVLNAMNQIQIVTTANQDTPFSQNLCPILNLDVWEHAYYLKHYNLRADYITDWFHVVDWKKVDENLVNCLSYF